MFRTASIAALGLSLLAGCAQETTEVNNAGFSAVDVTYESRGVAVPATIVTPANNDGTALPLVVMAHGHGGSREEGGGFRRVAEALAERGVATIRMDFPGCGDSTESFAENNLTNMLQDLQAGRAFAEGELNVDPDRVGLLGYSMGGRLVALLSEIDPSYQAMVAWAPAVSDGSDREMRTTFGGPEAYAEFKAKAEAEGSVTYTTMWGTELVIGAGWFRDIESSRPQAALAKFEGPLLVIYGDADEAVSPEIAASAITAATSSSETVELRIPGAQHGLGFYTNRVEIADQVVKASAEFLSDRL